MLVQSGESLHQAPHCFLRIELDEMALNKGLIILCFGWDDFFYTFLGSWWCEVGRCGKVVCMKVGEV